MKIKLDLHPIYNDSAKIEAELQRVLDDAVAKRAAEVEIIPGKGSGALKKTVLRFLDRPEVKARYHRLEKDSDNWGRLFVHFRPPAVHDGPRPVVPVETIPYTCFCCGATVGVVTDDVAEGRETRLAECPSCGSPNRLTLQRRRDGRISIRSESGYE